MPRADPQTARPQKFPGLACSSQHELWSPLLASSVLSLTPTLQGIWTCLWPLLLPQGLYSCQSPPLSVLRSPPHTCGGQTCKPPLSHVRNPQGPAQSENAVSLLEGC